MKIVYDKRTGEIIVGIPEYINTSIYFSDYPKSFKENLSELISANPPLYFKNYRVVDGNLVRLSKQEIFELQEFGKILTDEERVLEELKPSFVEVQKAQNQIEILTTIQEVM